MLHKTSSGELLSRYTHRQLLEAEAAIERLPCVDLSNVVRETGIEPAPLAGPDPKSTITIRASSRDPKTCEKHLVFDVVKWCQFLGRFG